MKKTIRISIEHAYYRNNGTASPTKRHIAHDSDEKAVCGFSHPFAQITDRIETESFEDGSMRFGAVHLMPSEMCSRCSYIFNHKTQEN